MFNKGIYSPDRYGKIEEISLCYQSISELNSDLNPYYGCAVGRVANRLNFHKIKIL